MPPAYVFESIRASLAGNALTPWQWLPGLGLAALYIVLGCAYFRGIFRHALKTGLIARYSAESVG